MISQNADKFEDATNVVEFVLNIAPHQSDLITSPEGVNGYSIDHTWDMLSGNDMKNLRTAFKTNTAAKSLGLSHKNKSFTKEVGAFIDAYLGSGEDNEKLITNFVNTMRDYGVKVIVN